MTLSVCLESAKYKEEQQRVAGRRGNAHFISIRQVPSDTAARAGTRPSGLHGDAFTPPLQLLLMMLLCI